MIVRSVSISRLYATARHSSTHLPCSFGELGHLCLHLLPDCRSYGLAIYYLSA